MTWALKLEGFSAGYAHREVVRNLTLAPFVQGTVTALVGPNGAGKSTLLRAIAGLHPGRGTRELASGTVIGFVPQALPQPTSLRVIESLLGAVHAGNGDIVSTRVAESRALAALDRFGMVDLGMEPLAHLSGGQRQLVGLAQVLVRDPRLLLLDEPTSALDLRHQVVVMSLIRDLAAEGRTLLVVLHDLGLAARWADRVVVLHRGAAVADGPADAALSSEVLAEVYGVDARVESCSRGMVQVIVDGLLPDASDGR
jgi:iron complex transport system ATP-binding protein